MDFLSFPQGPRGREAADLNIVPCEFNKHTVTALEALVQTADIHSPAGQESAFRLYEEERDRVTWVISFCVTWLNIHITWMKYYLLINLIG